MMRHMLTTGVALLSVCWPGGSLHARPVEPPPSHLALAGEAGMGAIGGTAHATIQSGIDVRERGLSLGVFGRVRLALERGSGESAVYGRDFDEATDYVHLLRYVQYRRAFKSVRLEADEGELLGYTLGHGTLIQDYSNISDPDHPHSGLRLRIEGERVAAEAMLDNIIRPSIVGARVDFAPLAKVPALRTGASFVMDPRAPRQVRLGPAGARMVDSARNLESENEPLGLLGFEVEYALGDGERIRVTPYSDLNTSLHGVGLHIGGSGRFRLSPRGVYLGAQLEYNVSSDEYSPAYIETFYDVERYQPSLSLSSLPRGEEASRRGMTKLGALEQGLFGGHGLFAQVGLDVRSWLRLKTGFARRPGPDANRLWVRASASPTRRLDLGMLLLARGLGAPGAGANGLAAIAEGRVKINDYLYGLAQYTRLWSLEEVTRFYGVLQSFNISLGASWSG